LQANQEALSKKPTVPDYLDTKGLILLRQRKHEEALIWFDNAIDINPNSVSASYHKGELFFLREEYDDALKCYNKALEVKPRFAEAYNAKAIMYAA
jgi:tetratricopeptide (TPR) repeat protein